MKTVDFGILEHLMEKVTELQDNLEAVLKECYP